MDDKELVARVRSLEQRLNLATAAAAMAGLRVRVAVLRHYAVSADGFYDTIEIEVSRPL